MRGLSLSPDNNLYISNCWTHSILKVDKNNGETATLADSKLEFGPFFAILDPSYKGVATRLSLIHI